MTERTYEGNGIRVFWNSDVCIHSTVCFSSLPDVFNPQNRPWVTIDGATADAIEQTVLSCPSGALTCERIADGE